MKDLGDFKHYRCSFVPLIVISISSDHRFKVIITKALKKKTFKFNLQGKIKAQCIFIYLLSIDLWV